MSIGNKEIAHCLASLVNMQGGFVIIPENERKMIEHREVHFGLNPKTGTITIRVKPEEGEISELDESGESYV